MAVVAAWESVSHPSQPKTLPPGLLFGWTQASGCAFQSTTVTVPSTIWRGDSDTGELLAHFGVHQRPRVAGLRYCQISGAAISSGARTSRNEVGRRRWSSPQVTTGRSHIDLVGLSKNNFFWTVEDTCFCQVSESCSHFFESASYSATSRALLT